MMSEETWESAALSLRREYLAVCRLLAAARAELEDLRARHVDAVQAGPM